MPNIVKWDCTRKFGIPNIWYKEWGFFNSVINETTMYNYSGRRPRPTEGRHRGTLTEGGRIWIRDSHVRTTQPHPFYYRRSEASGRRGARTHDSRIKSFMHYPRGWPGACKEVNKLHIQCTCTNQFLRLFHCDFNFAVIVDQPSTLPTKETFLWKEIIHFVKSLFSYIPQPFIISTNEDEFRNVILC